jgi:hypothetical protein
LILAGQALININSNVGQLVGGALIGAVIASQGGTALGYQKQKEQLSTMKSNN